MAHSTAKGLAALGRNGDTMLVHMSPHEVAGLHALALSHGTSLTINPKTGLPEAFSLGGIFKSLLPMVAGGLLAATGIGAPIAALMVGGASTILNKGDWKKGLMDGLGAFGGAGIGASLAGAGTAANAGLNLGKEGIRTIGEESLAKASQQGLGTALKGNLNLMGQGLKAAVPGTASYVPGMAGQVGSAIGMKTAMAAATPTMAEMSKVPTVKPGKETPPMFYNTSFNPGKYNAETRSFEGQGYGPGTWSTQFPGMPAATPAAPTNYSRGNMPGSLANQGQAQQPNPLYGQPGQPQYLPSAGIMAGMQGMAEGGPIATSTYPMSSLPASTYSAPLPYGQMADGGDVQEYKAGGILRGPGDGMSDSIPAVIKGPKPQRAALADGEFVIPADVVSHLGNGSTEAGSKHLYKMMDKVRQARTGNHKQGKKINPSQFLSA